MKGKYEKKSSRTEKILKIILWAAAILKLVNEAVNFMRNFFD